MLSPILRLSVNTASSCPSGVRLPAVRPTRSTRSPRYASEVFPADGGNDGVCLTEISVAVLTLPTTSVAVNDSVSLTAAVKLVANEPSGADVEKDVAAEFVSTTVTIRPPALIAPDSPCTSDTPLFGGSAKIRLAFGAGGGVCFTTIETVDVATSPTKS